MEEKRAQEILRDELDWYSDFAECLQRGDQDELYVYCCSKTNCRSLIEALNMAGVHFDKLLTAPDMPFGTHFGRNGRGGHLYALIIVINGNARWITFDDCEDTLFPAFRSRKWKDKAVIFTTKKDANLFMKHLKLKCNIEEVRRAFMYQIAEYGGIPLYE